MGPQLQERPGSTGECLCMSTPTGKSEPDDVVSAYAPKRVREKAAARRRPPERPVAGDIPLSPEAPAQAGGASEAAFDWEDAVPLQAGAGCSSVRRQPCGCLRLRRSRCPDRGYLARMTRSAVAPGRGQRTRRAL